MENSDSTIEKCLSSIDSEIDLERCEKIIPEKEEGIKPSGERDSTSTQNLRNVKRSFEIQLEMTFSEEKCHKEVEASSCMEICRKCCGVFGLEFDKNEVKVKMWCDSVQEYVEFIDISFNDLPNTLRMLVVDLSSAEKTNESSPVSEAVASPIPYNVDHKSVKIEDKKDRFEYEEVDVNDVIVDQVEIKVNVEEADITEEQPRQSMKSGMEKGSIPSEEEVPKDEGTKKPPKEIINGLRISVTKPNNPLINRKTKIAVIGKVSSGKSSLLNFLMYGCKDYICPTGPMNTTMCISYHEYYDESGGRKDEDEDEDEGEEEKHEKLVTSPMDIGLIKKRLDASNTSKKAGEEIYIKSFRNEFWKNVQFVDTPGLDDFLQHLVGGGERSENCRKIIKVRKKIEDVIRSSDVVLFLVDPRNLDSRDVHDYLLRVTELNNNVIIAVTKFDLMVKQICEEQKRDYDLCEKEDSLETEIIRIINLLQEKFITYGSPVVTIQVREKASTEGPHYFDSQYLIHVVRSLQNPRDESMLSLRNRMYQYMETRRLIPIRIFGNHKEKVRTTRSKILAIGAALSSSAILGGAGMASVGLGTIVLAIPGVGFTIGGAALASGVAMSGVAVSGVALVGGTIAFGSIAGILGGLVAFKISSSIGKWSLNVPPSGRVAMSFFHEDVGNVIGRVEIEKNNVWKKIVKYEEKSRISGGTKESNLRKKYFLDDEQDYYDTAVVRYDGKYFVIDGRFKNAKLLTIINIYQVLKMERKKKRRKK